MIPGLPLEDFNTEKKGSLRAAALFVGFYYKNFVVVMTGGLNPTGNVAHSREEKATPETRVVAVVVPQ